MSYHLEGQRVGRLTVIENVQSYRNERMWRCACDCGGAITVPSYKLVSGRKRSCGCLEREVRGENGKRTGELTFKNLSGQRFGRLLVLNRTKDKHRRRRGTCFDCLCDCGTSSVVRGGDLRYGSIRSCGCVGIEALKAIPQELRFQRGHKAAKARFYPNATEEEYFVLQQTKKMWKGLEQYVRQQRNEHEAKPPEADAALSA